MGVEDGWIRQLDLDGKLFDFRRWTDGWRRQYDDGWLVVHSATLMDDGYDFEGTVLRSRPLSDGGWWASRMDSDGDLLMLLGICIFLMDGWRQQ